MTFVPRDSMNKLVSASWMVHGLPKPVSSNEILFETDKHWFVPGAIGPGKVYCSIVGEAFEGLDVVRVWINKQGLAHRMNGPAVESNSGYKMWMMRGYRTHPLPTREYPPPTGG